MIRWWILIGYCSLLAAGCYAILVQHRPVFPQGYVAATGLSAGRLLQPADLLPAPEAGRYLAAGVKPNDPVDLATTLPLPPLPAGKDKVTVALPVSAASVASGDSNGGANVYVCAMPPAKAPVSGPDAVLGAICATPGPAHGPAQGKDCIALIDLPVADAAALASARATAAVTVSAAKCPTP